MFNKDLIKKFIVVLVGLFLFRLGSHIPVPGIDPIALALMFKNLSGTIIEMFNTFSGGSLKRLSIFAIGVMPYITASITIQILTLVSVKFKEIKNDGMEGQLRIMKYTRYLTIIVGTIQSIGLIQTLKSQAVEGLPIIPDPSLMFQVCAVLTLLAGTMTLVWIGEKITEYGIGNGLSLIIFSSIISNIPTAIKGTLALVENGELSSLFAFFVLFVVFFLLFVVVVVEKAQRRIPIVNTQVNKKGASTSFLPFKVNMAGILPPIIASSLMLLPNTLGMWLTRTTETSFFQSIGRSLSHGSYLYLIVFTTLVVLFSYVFNSLQHNPFETAKQLKYRGVFIKGFKPGYKTGEYLNEMMGKLTFIGSIYLAGVCIVPEIMIYYWKIPFYFGGTSILIMVMVALEWETQINSHFRSNDYKKIKDKINEGF